jgi:hypothetical protein
MPGRSVFEKSQLFSEYLGFDAIDVDVEFNGVSG